MRTLFSWLLILLIFTGLAPPVLAADIPRHLDPSTLPNENPDPEKLFALYYQIFHETAQENTTGARVWFEWAKNVKAPENLAPTLGRYHNDTGLEIGQLADVRVLVGNVTEMLRRLDPGTLQATNQALNELDEASLNLDQIDYLSGTLGQILNHPTTQLDNGVVELRQLIQTYYDQLNLLKADLAKELNMTRPILLITVDKQEAFLGENLGISGNLQDANGTALPSRIIIIYFDDTVVANTSTTKNGGIEVNFTIPYVYEKNATIYAEYRPGISDAPKYGRTISNKVIIDLLWIQPTLTLEVPDEAHPGMELRVSGLLSHDGVVLVGVKITVTALGGAKTDETSRMGSFVTVAEVPAETSEGTQQIFVHSEASGIYAPATAQASVDITRYASQLSINHPSWVYSGQKMVVEGKVESSFGSMNGTIIELTSNGVKNTVIASADGSFQSEVELPQSFLSSTYTIQAVSHPSLWIREASANTSVLVVNPLSLMLIIGLASVLTYELAKRIKLKPRKSAKRKTSVAKKTISEPLVEQTQTTADPNSVKGVFQWLVTQISARFNVTLGRTMTIREWLNSIRQRTDAPQYSLIERLGILYERSVYGKPVKGDGVKAKNLLDKLREYLP